MRNIDKELIQEIIYRLSPYTVKTVETSEITYPYVKISGIKLMQQPNKDSLYYYGTVNIEYRDQSTNRNYSIASALDAVNDIKDRLQQGVSETLIDGMVFFNMIDSTGIVQPYGTENVYSSVLSYEFKVNSELTFYDRVIRDGGVDECVLK